MRFFSLTSGNLKTVVLYSVFSFVIILSTLSAIGQCVGPACPGGGNLICRIHKIQANINPWIKSYMEIKPVDYATNPTRKYPLLVYLGGTGEMFQVPNNNDVELCGTVGWSMPWRINNGQFPNEVVFNGQSYSYFVVMPFAQTGDSHFFDPIDPFAMIDYVLAHYPGRIDVTRIYLTGMSRGTENIMGNLTQNINNAKRIAASFIVANCFQSTGLSDFNQRVAVLANSNTHLWGVSCTLDHICDPINIQNYVNGVNALAPGHAIYTGYTDPPPPSPVDYCQGVNAGWHYAWNFAYSPVENRPPATGGLNPYEWMIQFSQTQTLPVILEDWTARLENDKVSLQWTTSNEFNTKDFVVQRSTAAGNFENILTVPAAIASSTEKKYQFFDDKPIKGQNLYRLVLHDQDGKETFFDIKRVNLPGIWDENIIVPNPIKNGMLSVYLKVDRTQQVSFRLVDLAGRVLHQQNKLISAGATQYNIGVSSIQKGVYLVQIVGEDFKTAKKVSID